MSRGSIALLIAMVCGILLPIFGFGAASAAVCLNSRGVTVVVDTGNGDPSSSCVPEGAGLPASEVFANAEAATHHSQQEWSLWTSDGTGTWTRRTESPDDVTVSDGGFVAWRKNSDEAVAEPRVAPRPLTEAERQVATKPPGTGAYREGDALSEVVVVVMVVVGVLGLLVAGVWILHRRESRTG